MALVTSNVLTRVFHVKVGTKAGTGFILDVAGRQYLCTAKHVLTHFDNEEIGLFSVRKKEWKQCKAKLVGCGSHHSDIAVLALDQALPGLLTMPPATMESILISQETYYLGFPIFYGKPHGLYSVVPGHNSPVAMVKQGIVSAIVMQNQQTILLLDGYAHEGFSGGPVIFQRISDGKLCIAAVVSGSGKYPRPVKVQDSDTGEMQDLDPAPMVEINTGIVVAFSIQHALDVIEANSIGPRVNAG